ncbi:hypothetical protein HBP99_04290 [Listeria booriae]|uniref:BppU family phage baseplate upper protein n=1 Tax=Listeria booriae TaxID=1552123 RepID=UPI001623963D|nr:BppU family phage baseplate upper protein [Listeria booriae]MBC2367839.1 hypothetical protein [Listeria booriae]
MADTQKVTLSLTEENHAGILMVRRNNLKSNTYSITVAYENKAFNFTGKTLAFEARTPTGEVIRDYNYDGNTPFTNIVPAKGTFDLTINNDIFTERGKYHIAYIVFETYNPTSKLMTMRETTWDFRLFVTEDAYMGLPTIQSSIGEWLELIAQYKKWQKELEDLLLGDKTDMLAQFKAVEDAYAALNAQFNSANVVKKSGDTMTGDLAFDVTGERLIRAYDPATKVFQAGIFFNLTGFGVADWKNNIRPLTYSTATKKFNFIKDSLTLDGKNVATEDFVKNYSVEKEIFKGAAYFLDTNVFTWNTDDVKEYIYIEVSRYQVGTGALDYGKNIMIIPKSSLTANAGTAYWMPMAGTDGAKKVFYCSATSIKGHADNSESPNNGWCVRRIVIK